MRVGRDSLDLVLHKMFLTTVGAQQVLLGAILPSFYTWNLLLWPHLNTPAKRIKLIKLIITCALPYSLLAIIITSNSHIVFPKRCSKSTS